MPQSNFQSGSVAAGGTYLPLTGWAYEFLPWPARVKILANCDKAAGTIQVYSGAESIVDPSILTTGSTGVLPADLNTHPIIFDAPAGDRLRINCTSGTAATQFNLVVLVTPLA